MQGPVANTSIDALGEELPLSRAKAGVGSKSRREHLIDRLLKAGNRAKPLSQAIKPA